MKRTVLFVALSISLLFYSFISSPTEKGFSEIHYGDIDPIETDEYRIAFSDMHSQATFALVRAEFTNKTDDFLFIELSKVSYTLPDGSKIQPVAKKVKINPNATKKISIKAPGSAGLPAENLEVEIGGITQLPVNGEVENLEDYPLPDTKKKITSNNVSIALNTLKKETKVTEAKFKVQNTGDTPILVNNSLITVTCEGNDKVWPCEAKSSAYKILWPGKSMNLKATFKIPGKIVDMQFANMSIHWNKALVSSSEKDLKGGAISLKMDLGKTEGMNK